MKSQINGASSISKKGLSVQVEVVNIEWRGAYAAGPHSVVYVT
jgi:hypothetical protein